MSIAPLNAFWSMVDGVMAINLQSRKDRWEDLLAKTAYWVPDGKLKRLSAIVGTDLPGYGKLPWFRNHCRDKTWAGRAGCALSHRAAIEHAKQSGWRTLLILEDDIQLTPDFDKVLAALPGTLDKHPWDVCYLGYTNPVTPYQNAGELPAGHELCRVSGCSTTHAYLLNSTTFDWLLAQLPAPGNIWQWISQHRAIDRWYYRNLARRFTVYAVSPSIINQQEGFSDITRRQHEKSYIIDVPAQRSSGLLFSVLGRLRWLGFRLAEPRDWLRGKIKQARGF
jgi:GR25 family glycosyltransferase involved in LPS biosynthesis